MSPRALARAISVDMPITKIDEPSTAGHAARDQVNAWPETAKNVSHASVAIVCVHATMTIGGIACARPLTIANWTACVTAAPSESRNQFRRARPRSDPGPEAAGAAHGHRLAKVARRMKERDAAQHAGPRTAGERLDDLLGAAAKCALGRRLLHGGPRDLTAPVAVLEPGDDLARSAPDGVAILAQRREVDGAREIGHLGRRHADAEVPPRDREPLGPRVVEDLRAAGHHHVHHDVLGARDVPHDPRER